MKVKGKSVRTLTKLINLAKELKSIRLVFNTSSANPETWMRVGFDRSLTTGDYLMPQCLGKATLFNANGKEVIRKDLPKEPQPRSFYTTWQDWHGQEHSGIQTRNIDMYPREYILAPSEILTIIELNNIKYIATDSTTVTSGNDVRNLHLMNIMLECFEEFEIVDEQQGFVIGSKLRQLQWDVLPPGKYPWEYAKTLVGKVTQKLKESERKVVESRMELITKYNPDFIATGRGGFSGYFVYGFELINKFILESIHLDNATYVFEEEWEKLSRLTKNEIINGAISHQRIIHDQKWHSQLRKLMEIKHTY